MGPRDRHPCGNAVRSGLICIIGCVSGAQHAALDAPSADLHQA
jgi:hypothetical protein